MNKIEQYLIDLMYTYRQLEDNLWLLEDPEHNLDGVAVLYSDPLVIVRTQVMDAPRERRLEFFTKLLELNARDMVHGAYALEGETVVIIDSLEYDTMDRSELQASLEAVGLAVTQHYEILKVYRDKGR
jgi:hypothetical protein